MDQTTIIQWNCRGFWANFEEIKSLLFLKEPVVLCLQETYLKAADKCSLKGYAEKSTHSTATDGRPIGGTSIFIREDVPHTFISLSSPLQAVAARVHLHRPVTVCSLYLPPSCHYNTEDLEQLWSQLPSPALLLGDFNAHSELWGCQQTLPDANSVESFIDRMDISLLNNGSPTYLHPGNGCLTSIDLSFCSPCLFMDFEWRVAADQFGSDHFPIFISSERFSNQSISSWQLTRANWDLFDRLCQVEITQDDYDDVDEAIDLFSSRLISIASRAVPKSSTSSKRQRRPWFNKDCQKAVRLRRAALQRFKGSPSSANLSLYRQARANARRIVKAAKKESWRNYVSKLNVRSSVKKTWDMVRKISGKYKGQSVCHLQLRNGDTATDKESIAEALADEFAFNSSTSHYSDKFQAYKAKAESRHLCFEPDGPQFYNGPFTLLELQLSLKRCHDTAVGPDEVHYQFLKHLPPDSLAVLLGIFNAIWRSNAFPSSWREATIIPIPKPGKDSSIPSNYRPIALTSCLCKTMERMVNGRLVHFLESRNLLTPSQSGFRSHRTTTDHLVALETFIRDGFIQGDHVVSVFFDLEKAYDTTWKYGIMKDLFNFGLQGHLPLFIQNFLSNRRFNVRLGSCFSSPHDQEMGVPQGSVLSVTLFSVKINDITSTLKPGVHNSLYVDDFAIAYRSRNMASIERQLQLCLNKLQDWADQNGFKFSPSKTNCVHFCNRRGLHPHPSLTLNGQPIPVVEKTKFLGLIFDSKLNFKPHIDYLRAKCEKAINLLRVVSKMDWGADRKVLLRLYRSLVRSRLDYGASVYGSARPSYLKKLEPVQNQALRLALGAFRTSPVSSLHVEANEMPMQIRRHYLSLQYALKVYANCENPAHALIHVPGNISNFYSSKPNAIRPFFSRIAESLDIVCPDSDLVCPTNTRYQEPYWLLQPPEIDTSLSGEKKSNLHPSVLRSDFLALAERYPGYKHVYTDGSKCEAGVASAAISDDFQVSLRLPDTASIYTAELVAIYESLNLLSLRSDVDDILLLSDSLSCIMAVANFNIDHPYVFKILQKCTVLKENGKDIVFMWCPSHIGIAGNEKADALAKQSVASAVCSIRIPFSDFRPGVGAHCRSLWQAQWDEEEANKLRALQPTVGVWPGFSRERRREEVVLSRARIGHTYLTHGYLLRREIQPECIPCFSTLTVKHILIECTDFAVVRQRHYTANSMKELFEKVDPSKILSFLMEIGLFYKF